MKKLCSAPSLIGPCPTATRTRPGPSVGSLLPDSLLPLASCSCCSPSWHALPLLLTCPSLSRWASLVKPCSRSLTLTDASPPPFIHLFRQTLLSPYCMQGGARGLVVTAPPMPTKSRQAPWRLSSPTRRLQSPGRLGNSSRSGRLSLFPLLPYGAGSTSG